MNPIIIIPVRLNSTRLPQKALIDIKGKPMIARVWERAIEADIGDVVVACDDERIAAVIKDLGGNVVMTNPNHPSGSDRVYEAVGLYDPDQQYNVIINLQGDLPCIDPKIIKDVLNPFAYMDAQITTLANKFESEQSAKDPNNVKAAISFMDKDVGKALYFSRSVIPYGSADLYHHIGIYAYTRQALDKFVSLKPSPLELTEKLEQLRALENGMVIGVQVIEQAPISVDTPQDLSQLLASM